MPSAESALFSLLTTGSPNPVAAIVGTRVHGNELPQNVEYPCIRYSRISTPREQWRTLDEPRTHYANPRFQLDCFGLKHLDAINVAQAVYAVLEGFAGTVSGLRIDTIAPEDEAGGVEPGAGPAGASVHTQRVDVLIYHAE